MRKIMALLLCAVLVAGLFSGCVRDDEPYVPTGGGLNWDDPTEGTGEETIPQEQELSMAYTRDEPFNPYLTTDVSNRALSPLLYQGLFTVDSDYTVWPVLCRSYWVSDDMRTYVFYIREDATFSDGTPLTTDDVEATLLYAMESDMYKGRFSKVDEVQVDVDGGVVVTLDTAYENFPILMDIPILKESQLEEERPLGTGPYQLNESAGGLRMIRRTDWWSNAELPVASSAVSLVAADTAVQIRDEFEMGDVNLVCANPGSDDYVDYRCDYELWDCENGEFLYLACSMDSEIFSNEAVRSALTYGIDREAIVDEFYNGFAREATLAASPLSPYYNSNLAAQYAYNGTTFAQAVEDAELVGQTLTILVNSADGRRVRMSQMVGAMMEAAGFVVEYEMWSGNDYLYMLAIREYDLYVGLTKLSANMDLTAFFSSGGALNYGGIQDAAMYSLCLDALANRGNYDTLHRMVADDGRLCPILFGGYAVCVERGLASNLDPSRDNVFCYNLGIAIEDILLDARADATLN